MDRNHIFTEILYEYKRSSRNVIFRIFVILGIVGDHPLHVHTTIPFGGDVKYRRTVSGTGYGLGFAVIVFVHSL